MDRETCNEKYGMDGKPPAKQSYQEWLEGQSEDVQKEVLGEKKWKLWKEKGLSTEELKKVDGRKSLDELLESEGLERKDV